MHRLRVEAETFVITFLNHLRRVLQAAALPIRIALIPQPPPEIPTIPTAAKAIRAALLANSVLQIRIRPRAVLSLTKKMSEAKLLSVKWTKIRNPETAVLIFRIHRPHRFTPATVRWRRKPLLKPERSRIIPADRFPAVAAVLPPKWIPKAAEDLPALPDTRRIF